MKKGLFITFEGADGSGKTTQINKLYDYLTQKGYECVLTREPGGTDLGNKIRDILLNYDGEVYSLAELLLYMADRAQHIKTKILPAINEGKIVLCDRHIDSSVAYQGYARGLDIERITMLNTIATEGYLPDLTVLFDIETEVAMKRVGDVKDRLEAEGFEFHRKLRMGYLELQKKYPERIKKINSNNDIETVFEDLKNLINGYLNE